MKKITYMLLLIQSGFMIAQTKTVVTPSGEKVTISPYANNGIEINSDYTQLGGNLIKASVLNTTSSYTLALKGLQTGVASDKLLTVDANNILKWIDRSTLTGDNLGNHTAATNLNMNGSNINSAASITATGKTSTKTAQIAMGTDNKAPQTGYIITAANSSGDVIWSPPAQQQGRISGTWEFSGTNQVVIAINSGNVAIPMDANKIILPKDAYVLITYSILPSCNQIAYNKNPAMAQGAVDLKIDNMKQISSYFTAINMGTPAYNFSGLGNYTTAQKMVLLSAGTHTIDLSLRVWSGSNSTGLQNASGATVSVNKNAYASGYAGSIASDDNSMKTRISVIAFNK